MNDQTPKVHLVPVRFAHKSVLANLMQFYRYDFSDLRDLHVTPHGTYEYAYLDYYFNEPSRAAAFIVVDEKQLAGFVLTSRRNDHNHVSEFFVMKGYRRRGVGRLAATKMFRRSPGRWSLEIDHANQRAMDFWTTIIDEVSTGPIEREDRHPPKVDHASALLEFTVEAMRSGAE